MTQAQERLERVRELARHNLLFVEEDLLWLFRIAEAAVEAHVKMLILTRPYYPSDHKVLHGLIAAIEDRAPDEKEEE